MYPKIMAAVPVYHAVEPEPFLNFLILSQWAGKAELEGRYAVRWCVPGPKTKTVTARNIVSNLAIAGELDYVFLIDDDMVVPKDTLDILLRRNVDIVSPIFFRSVPPIDPLVFTFDRFGDRVPYYDYPKQAIFETPGGNGTGCMLIKVDVFRAMDPPIWRGEVDAEISEDIEFCTRARSLGFKTWCDSTVEARQMSLPVAIGSPHYEQGRLTR
jgi:hypothetical protein